MKAITIWQPYASFITAGLKHYETRGWKKKLVDGEWKHYCPECVEVKEP